MRSAVGGLESFLVAVRTEGVVVGALERSRLRHAFARAPALDDGGLLELLRCTLAKSTTQREVVERAFETWVADAERTIDRRTVWTGFDALPPRPPPPEKPETPVIRRAWVGIAAASLVAAGLAVVLLLRPDPSQPVPPRIDRSPSTATDVVGPPDPATDIVGPPDPAADVARPPDPATDVAGPPDPAPGEPPSDPIPQYVTWVATRFTIVPAPRPWVEAALFVALGLAALFAAWLVGLCARRDERHEPTIEPVEGPSWQPLTTIPIAGNELLDRAQQRTLVWGVGRFVSEDPTDRVDLPRTVDRTARAAGVPTIVRQRATYPREVWLWQDERTEDPAIEELAEEIATSLRKAGLTARRGFFHGSPEHVAWENGERFRPVVLEGHRQTSIVAVLTDGAGLAASVASAEQSRDARAMLSSLAGWPRLAFADFGHGRFGLTELLRGHGIASLRPDRIASFLGANERATGRPRRPAPLVGALEQWAAALALGPDVFDVETAHAIRHALDLPLSSWSIRDLVLHAAPRGTGYAFEANERVRLLNRLATFERFDAADADGLVARATGYWSERYEAESARRHEEQTPIEPWDGTEAELGFQVETALLRLWRRPNAAATSLHRLAESPLRAEIEARLRSVAPRPADMRKMKKFPSTVFLPWTRERLTPEAAWILTRLGFGRGHLSALDRKASGTAAAAIGLALGIGVGAIVAGSWMLRVEGNEPTFRTEPPVPAAIQTFEDGFPVAGMPAHLETWTNRAGLGDVVDVEWRHETRATVERLGAASEIWNRGRRAVEPAHRPANWPKRTFAVIAGDPTSVDARRLALHLLDGGGADRVLLTRNPDQRGYDALIGDVAAGRAGEQVLFFAVPQRKIDDVQLRGVGHSVVLAIDGAVTEFVDAHLRFAGVRTLDAMHLPAVFDIRGTPRLRGSFLDMVPISGGSFLLGGPESEEGRYDDDGPQHRVTVAPFWIGRTEATRELYRSILGSDVPSAWADDGSDESLPANFVTWLEAVRFCNALSNVEGLALAYTIDGRAVTTNAGADGYRLPTEAEWEFAARAGTTTRYFFGDDDADLGRYAWFGENGDSQAHLVDKKDPNPWGLHDMLGNVWEWCEDTWHESYKGAPSDGSAWVDASTSARVLRGGSAWVPSRFLRCAFRDRNEPEVSRVFNGFRVVRSARRQP